MLVIIVANGATTGAETRRGEDNAVNDLYEQRLNELVAVGIPQETADVAAKLLEHLAVDTGSMKEWSVFARLREDPPALEIWNENTGVMVTVAVIPP